MADTFAWVNPNKWASCTRYAVLVIGERGSRYEVMALEPCWLDGRNRRLQRGETAFVSKAAVKWMSAASSAQWDNTARLLSAASMLRLEAKQLS